jgi:hypothetical protein
MDIQHGTEAIHFSYHSLVRYRERHLLFEESAFTDNVVRLRIIEEMILAERLTARQALAFLGNRRRSLDPECEYWRWADRVFVLKRGNILLTILRIDEPLDRLLDSLEEYADEEPTLA